MILSTQAYYCSRIILRNFVIVFKPTEREQDKPEVNHSRSRERLNALSFFYFRNIMYNPIWFSLFSDTLPYLK